MNSKEWLRKKGIHPTEPIYWDFIHSTISLDELLEEYALYKQLQNTSSNSDYTKLAKWVHDCVSFGGSEEQVEDYLRKSFA